MKSLLIIIALLVSQQIYGECNTVLKSAVEGKLWQEAIEAEEHLYALRMASALIISHHIKSTELVLQLDDQNEEEIIELINKEKLKELAVSQSQFISDLYHFGVPMNLPIVGINQDEEAVEKLFLELSDKVPSDQLVQFSQSIAMRALAENSDNFPAVYKMTYDWAQENYVSIFAALKDEEGFEHQHVYEFKHDLMEITNYGNRVLREAKGSKTNIGFMPVENAPDPEEKKPIGFIH